MPDDELTKTSEKAKIGQLLEIALRNGSQKPAFFWLESITVFLSLGILAAFVFLIGFKSSILVPYLKFIAGKIHRKMEGEDIAVNGIPERMYDLTIGDDTTLRDDSGHVATITLTRSDKTSSVKVNGSVLYDGPTQSKFVIQLVPKDSKLTKFSIGTTHAQLEFSGLSNAKSNKKLIVQHKDFISYDKPLVYAAIAVLAVPILALIGISFYQNLNGGAGCVVLLLISAAISSLIIHFRH